VTEPARTTNPWLALGSHDGEEYDARYEKRAAAGENVHGEADFIERLGVKSVLDAGCGTGRTAREMHRRGLDVVGVDLDEQMISVGRRKAPEIEWHCADLETLELSRTFECVLMAGNVMVFLTPGTEGAVLANMAHHLEPGGLLVAGFQLQPGGGQLVAGFQLEPDRLNLERFDALARQAGFALADRYSTWDEDAWVEGGGYAVSVMRIERT
jgi:SAM-dependent methyltransferase